MHISLRKISILGRFPFVRFQQILDNPAYFLHLIKKNLFYKRSHIDYAEHYSPFVFLSAQKTLEKLIHENMSLARFSDGEFEQLTGGGEYPPDSDWCQKWSPSLYHDLKSVICSSDPRLLIAVDPPATFLAPRGSEHSIPFSYNMWVDMRRLMWTFLHRGQDYGHSHLFVPANAPDLNWDMLRDYLSDLNLIIATGNTASLSNLKIGKSLHFVECGKENAYERKEQIKQEIFSVIYQHNLDLEKTLVFASLGPTAGIIAKELLDHGVRVWDTGHMFKFAVKKVI